MQQTVPNPPFPTPPFLAKGGSLNDIRSAGRLWITLLVLLATGCPGGKKKPRAGRNPDARGTIALVSTAPNAPADLAVPAAAQVAIRKHLERRLGSIGDVFVIPAPQVEAAHTGDSDCREGETEACWEGIADTLDAQWMVRVQLEKTAGGDCQLSLTEGEPAVAASDADALTGTSRCLQYDLQLAIDDLLRKRPATASFAGADPTRPLCGNACDSGEPSCDDRARMVCVDDDWDGCGTAKVEACPEGEACSAGQCIAGGEGMVFVPEGRFQMGTGSKMLQYAMHLCSTRKQNCRTSWWRPEQPQHWVVLSGFWIDRTEVTQEQYAACVKAGKCAPVRESECSIWSRSADNWVSGGRIPSEMRGAKKPAICVTNGEAAAYCGWKGGRLPTEAEWEKAARGVDNRLYPWGNVPYDGSQANGCDKRCGEIASKGWRVERTLDDKHRYLADVGSFPAGMSPYGLLDMAGNVWEWVSDWYDDDYYGVSERRDPAGPEKSDDRVVRGGSWSNESDSIRAAYRYSLPPETRITTVGFRCAR